MASPTPMAVLNAGIAANRLTIHARLRLFLQVARAVAHAHARLIVHRDLKPSNILVTDDGEVKLLDFGIAKMLDDGCYGRGAHTQAGGRNFTPDYASPEQIGGEPLGIGTDVYSGGVHHYELLTGARPYTCAARRAGRWSRRSWKPTHAGRAMSSIDPRDARCAAISTPSF
jgi:serine/threonine-protein kinase